MSKDPAAVELGRKGGLAKVPKGTAVLSEKERKRRATEAANARWEKERKTARKKAARKKTKAGD
jgi:hypothetical protein